MSCPNDRTLEARLERAKEILSAHGVEFALLFGSVARGTARPWSDLDVAVYIAEEVRAGMSALDLGRLAAELEIALGWDVDLLVLNTSLRRRPALTHRVLAEGRLFFCKDRERFVAFRARAIQQYLGTAFLRAMVQQAFEERLRTGRLAPELPRELHE
jgi:predicted nucleotidyltransferase